MGREIQYSISGRQENDYAALVEWDWQGRTEMLGQKTWSSATLSIINHTRTDLELNQGLCVERPLLTAWDKAWLK